MSEFNNKAVRLTVIVAALGYFVDIYDLLLFGIVRVPSLKDIGVSDVDMMGVGLLLLNYQMVGMLIGGIVWGVLGDRRGRRSVLFGSILMYSLANLANAFVRDVDTYAILRFIAGVGLAGELGAAITLVSEVMSKETRGYGTAIVAGVGILGAVFASIIGDYFSWQVAYIIGGGMGISLLFLRAGLLESSMFDKMKTHTMKKGSFLKIITTPDLLFRYLHCISIGVPIWFVIGILITFSPEITSALGVSGVTAGRAIMWTYIGLAAGDLASGMLSQWLKSRKRALFIFMTMTLGCVLYYLYLPSTSLNHFYGLCIVLGFGAGYWAVFVTVSAEQFGTNIRATVATTVPNFVRAAIVPITFTFESLKINLGLVQSSLVVGLICFAIGYYSLWRLTETFGKDLNYFEKI
jgi:MFS family permease